MRRYRDLPARDVGTIRDVRITGVRGTVADDGRVTPAAAILVSGLPGHDIEDLRLRDLRLSLPGGGAAADALREVPLLASDYPEYRPLGVLPAFGAFLRHARRLRFERVVVETRRPDARPPVRQQDVSDLEVDGRPAR